jgi:hypothetical protein
LYKVVAKEVGLLFAQFSSAAILIGTFEECEGCGIDFG